MSCFSIDARIFWKSLNLLQFLIPWYVYRSISTSPRSFNCDYSWKFYHHAPPYVASISAMFLLKLYLHASIYFMSFHLVFSQYFMSFRISVFLRGYSLVFLMTSVVMNPHMPMIIKLCFLMTFNRHASLSISIFFISCSTYICYMIYYG